MGTKNIENISTSIGRLILATLLFSACVKDKPADPVVIQPPLATTKTVYVVCEGNMGNGDAALYQYEPETGTANGDVYSAVNGDKLGDVFQSVQRIDDKLFLCVNNSDKIVVLNNSDKKKVGSISVPKPRYILPVSSDKAYVSTLFSNKVYVINPKTMQVTGTIEMPFQNPEGMLMHNGKAYICTWDTACRNVYTVDIATDKISGSIAIQGAAPQEILEDKNKNLWILSGNASKGKDAGITVLDDNEKIIKSYAFPAKADVLKPVFNGAKDMFYFIEVNYYGGTDHNGIYRMSIDDTALPQSAFIGAEQFQYFWALGIDPLTGKIYVGDPKGFTQKGAVSVYQVDGSKTATFNVGVGPGHFFFD